MSCWSIAAAGVCSFLFAAATIYGGALYATGYYAEPPDNLAIPFLVVWLVAFMALVLASRIINYLQERIEQRANQETCAFSLVAPALTKRSIAVHSLVMFALWGIYTIALFPGSMNWDTYYQISQWYPGNPVWAIPWIDSGSVVDARFSDHHPLFDTLLYGLFAVPSDFIFGTWNWGVFAFVVLQSAFTATVLTVSAAYLRKVKAPLLASAIAYCFYCVMPFFPFSASTMLKDALFSPLFVIYVLMMSEMARTKGSFPGRRKRDIVAFVAIGLLVALTKKPGFYIVLATCVVLLLVYRGARRAILAQLLTVVLVMAVALPLVVFPLIGVIPGGKQEMLGPLFQQTARFVVQHPDEISAEERDAIDDVVAFEGLDDRYDSFYSDPVKFSYRYDTCTSEELTEYISVWLSQGLRHPETYVEASLTTSASYIGLLSPINVIGYTADIEHDGSDKLYNPKPLRPLREGLVAVYEFVSETPVLMLLFRIGLYSFVVPALVLVTLVGRRSRYSVVIVPVVLSVLVCFISPVIDARYAMPLVYLAPFLFGLCFASESDAG